MLRDCRTVDRMPGMRKPRGWGEDLFLRVRGCILLELRITTLEYDRRSDVYTSWSVLVDVTLEWGEHCMRARMSRTCQAQGRPGGGARKEETILLRLLLTGAPGNPAESPYLGASPGRTRAITGITRWNAGRGKHARMQKDE